MVCCLVVREPLVPSFAKGIGMEWLSAGFADFLMIIGWAASSSTFLSGGRTDEWVLMVGAADKVGFLSKSKSISTQIISLLIGAWLVLGLMERLASTLFSWFSLMKFSSLATIRSKASSSSSSLMRSLRSIFSISLKRAMNQLLKLYCPMMASNLSSSLPGFNLDCCSPSAMLSSGKSLHISQMQFILVLAVSKGRPKISSLINSPAANTNDLSSISLLVSTVSGEEYLKSCSSTKSSLVRSRFAKASRCATLTVRKLLVTKSEVGLSSLGSILASVRWRTI